MAGFLSFIFWLVLIVAYCANFVKLFTEHVAGMAIGRALGIFFPPLGVILGFF